VRQKITYVLVWELALADEARLHDCVVLQGVALVCVDVGLGWSSLPIRPPVLELVHSVPLVAASSAYTL
jgi:hypothetical protein